MPEDSLVLTGTYVYHRVPDDLRGTVLYPLNELRDVYPDLYERLQQNYVTRRDIAALRIPPLGNCLWNDVLFCSPVHPRRHLAALEAAGHTLPPEWRRYFQIDAAFIDPENAVIKESRQVLWSGTFTSEEGNAVIESECVPFRVEHLTRYADVPTEMGEYYATVPPGSPFPLFLKMAQILYKGRIDLTQPGVQVIEV